jgi:NADH:ubiquinone oxidoreductase subunit 1 (chain H)
LTEPWWISLIKAAVIVNVVLVLFAYLTLIERKVMGRMQLRYGPNRAGPYGLLQPIADLVKLVRKEAFVPSSAIGIPYILAPIISAFTAIAAFAVIPWGPGWTVHGWRINGEVANVSIGRCSSSRSARSDLRLHRRRLGLRVEVLDPRLDAHLRAARLL